MFRFIGSIVAEFELSGMIGKLTIRAIAFDYCGSLPDMFILFPGFSHIGRDRWWLGHFSITDLG
jgi:hypothetical protein